MEPAEVAERTRRVAAMFDLVAQTYDTVAVPWFGPIAAGLVERLGPRPGERALDLGTGRGAALWPLAAGVAPTGSVTAVDLSPRMVEATRAEVAARGLSDVEVLVGDASAPDLPAGTFDVVAASLVLFFLPDPPAALREWCRLLAPGGRLGLSTFGGRDEAWEQLDEVFTPYLPPALLDARTTGSRGVFGSDAALEELARDCGLGEVVTVTAALPVRFDGLEQWRAWTWSHGQRSHWLAVPDAERGAVLDAAATRVAPLLDADGGFTLTQQLRYTTGRRPPTGAAPLTPG